MSIPKLHVGSVRIVIPSNEDRGGVLAYASIVLNDCFIIRDIRIVSKPSGEVIVSMPYKTIPVGKCMCGRPVESWHSYCPTCGNKLPARRIVKKSEYFKDVAHPLDQDTRTSIDSLILEAYEKVLNKSGDLEKDACA